ncbi:hypothetical protein LJC67_05990 [Bacteroidales bacterium OttesenSCG-928-A14]|nr:hypothetical protein [Bacteroidales bacterium OttesenSCG-928-A14]
MKKYCIIFFFLMSMGMCFTTILSAQDITRYEPFKGFNIGLTGQMEMIQKIDFDYIEEIETLVASHAMGWETGLELSYHFARYFGFSLGLNVGTINAMKFSYYVRYSEFTTEREDQYCPISGLNFDFILPLQFEFHFPLKHNFYFTSSMGVKLKGLHLDKDLIYKYTYELCSSLDDGKDIVLFNLDYERNMAKTEVDLLLKTGVYYRLPYADFLRLTVGINFALNKYASGCYKFYPYENCSFGFFNMHNNFLYLQFAYIHTFGFMKMKKHVKKSMKPFPSKKERNQYVRELLKL